MPRIPRNDEPGSWHHVFNRGIARRLMFERRQDYRYFLAQLARAVHRGELEIHAYCLMGTHYHLLVRSPGGNLAAAMQRVQLSYSRWFNRSRRRDGPLVRSRYGSRVVRSGRYRWQLVRYIDSNPCSARLVAHPALFPWSSARHHSSRTAPPWLARDWIRSVIAEVVGPGECRPEDYDRAFPRKGAEELEELVHARLTREDADAFDDVFAAADARTRTWMIRKALLADGTRPGVPLTSVSCLRRLVDEGRGASWAVTQGRSKRDGWDLIFAGLGRDVAGARWSALARELGVSLALVHRMYGYHRGALRENPEYAERATALAQRALTEPGSFHHILDAS